MEVTRRVAFALLTVAITMSLAACGGGEAEQAKAFQEFLQTRILDKKGIHMPRPSDEQRRSFGRFAADYDVIVKFNDTLTDAMSSKLPEIMRRGNITSIAQLVDRRADVAAARDALSAASKTMATALADANAASAKVNQPPELKAVYDRAYARLVTEPAAVVGGIWPELDQALGLSLNFADFIAANRAKFEINGPMVSTGDKKLLAEFNTHVEGMRSAAQGVNDAQNAMRKLISGE